MLTAQSINLALPRIAKTITSWASTGTDFITMALVPRRTLGGMCSCLSCPFGVWYTRSEYWAAIQRRGSVDV